MTEQKFLETLHETVRSPGFYVFLQDAEPHIAPHSQASNL